MGYPVREYIPGYWYHVYSRGQRKEPLFFAPRDRRQYLTYLDQKLDRRGGKIGSFCLMTTHCHLLLKMEATPLGDILRNAHSLYARYFNDRYNLSGHVTQKRPGVKIVLDDRYLMNLVGYIHRNPVEAGIVESSTIYRWSSWFWFLGRACPWISLSSWQFPPGFMNKDIRSIRFHEMILPANCEYPDSERYIGTDIEWKHLRERRQKGRESQDYNDQRGRLSKKQILKNWVDRGNFSEEELRGPSRARDVSQLRQQAMADMYEEGHGVVEIARFFNRTPTAVTHAHKRWRSE